MYDTIPTILYSQELLDRAFRRATKITKEDKVPIYRLRKTTLAQLESMRSLLVEPLQDYVKRFPNLGKISSYERELIDIVVGVDPLRQALGRIDGAVASLEAVMGDHIRASTRTREVPELRRLKKAAVGRAASILEEVEGALRYLNHARDVLRAIPELTPGDPTIVVAGYPNVGKSSVLARLTKARPEIAPYAFTTKSANIGHFSWPETGPEHRRKRFQVVDTPGLLDQPPQQRNAIEKQAALALRYLADVIVFVLDPSEACGYDAATQERLLESAQVEFGGIPLLVVENKSDLRRSKSDRLKVSCETGAGLQDLRRRIVELVPKDKYQGLLGDEAFLS